MRHVDLVSLAVVAGIFLVLGVILTVDTMITPGEQTVEAGFGGLLFGLGIGVFLYRSIGGPRP